MRNNPEVRRQMLELIEQWQQSGLSQKAFCQQQSIRSHSFYYWYKRYRQQHASSQNNNSSLVELQIEKSAAASSIEINYPGGIRVIFHDPVSSNYLKALIS
jgi:transposase-like protein